MKIMTRLSSVGFFVLAAFACITVVALLMPIQARASAFDPIPGIKNPKDAMECLVFDERLPQSTVGTYFATYPHHAVSREGWVAPYYGGMIPNVDAKGVPFIGNLYSAWQMDGKDHPTSGIAFVHAGPWMGWQYSNWEGCAGGMSGPMPSNVVTFNSWYRFVHRVWLPTSGAPHTGYTGVWMKSLASGRWFHLSTIKYPAELTGFVNLQGFIEAYLGRSSTQHVAVDFRNVYSLRQNRWNSESLFSAYCGDSETIALTLEDNGRHVRMSSGINDRDPVTGKPATTKSQSLRVTLIQPAQPDFFDEARIDDPRAEWIGNQVVVRWDIADTNAPQLGYDIKVYDGDTRVATVSQNDPEARQCMLTLSRPPRGTVNVHMVLRDIFSRKNPEIVFKATLAAPLAASANIGIVARAWYWMTFRGDTTKRVPGLAYRYYETAKPADWTALPDFAQLTPKRTGLIETPDLTPRLKRNGYAFVYEGELRAPTPGLYTFDMVVASGARLVVDGQTVIDADGNRSIAHYPGTAALAAGNHTIQLSFYHGAGRPNQPDDFLQLLWAGPGFARTSVPASAFSRKIVGTEPMLTARAKQVDAATLELSCALKGAKAKHVMYYAVQDQFPFFAEQGANSMDYFLGETNTTTTAVKAPIWGGSSKTIWARAILEDDTTVDSAPVTLTVPDVARGKDANGMTLTELEYHLYPATHAVRKGEVTLVADSMTLLTRRHKGDVTIVARLADMITDQTMSDGTRLSAPHNWFSGIILRDNVAARPGEPLGGGSIPYIAVMVNASGDIRHCDSTMLNGAGNQPATLGKCEGARWLKLTRKGQVLSSFISKDGKDWKPVASYSTPTVSLKGNHKIPAMKDEIEVGFVQYSLPNTTPRIQWSKFDNLSIRNSAE